MYQLIIRGKIAKCCSLIANDNGPLEFKPFIEITAVIMLVILTIVTTITVLTTLCNPEPLRGQGAHDARTLLDLMHMA